MGIQRESDRRSGSSPLERCKVILRRRGTSFRHVLNIPSYFVEIPGQLLHSGTLSRAVLSAKAKDGYRRV